MSSTLCNAIATCVTKGGSGADKAEAEAAFQQLKKHAEEEGIQAAPFLIKGLPKIMEGTGNKDKKVALAAVEAIQAIMEALSPYAVKVVMPLMVDSLGNKKKPEEKVCALKMMKFLADKHPKEMAWCLVESLPPALELMTDIKKDVKAAAMEACTALSSTSGNKDVEPFIPQMMAAIEKPAIIGEVVEKLASVVFVQAVETPALAVAVPIVTRGLKDKKRTHKTKSLCYH